MKRTAAALFAGAAFGLVLGGVGIAAAGDDSGSDDRTSAAAASQSQRITEEQARDVAIEAVGGGQVKKVELEVEHGGLQWHIDVIKNGVEFDVRINADTGEVVRFRTDDDDHRVGDRDDDRSDDCDDDSDDDSSHGRSGSRDDDHHDNGDDDSSRGGSDDD